MEIDRVHFYVEDAKARRDWFVRYLGFAAIASFTHTHTHTEVVQSGAVCFLLSSPLSDASPVADFLRLHPPGVADVAFSVANLEALVQNATAQGARLLQPIREKSLPQGTLKWAQISGWGPLTHTLIEAIGVSQSHFPLWSVDFTECWPGDRPVTPSATPFYTHIDHVVLNVANGNLESAVSFYEKTLGFQRQQTFNIQTHRSGLHSQVMVHPHGGVQLPINEPSSENSQIQEFLNLNRGPGIQHIALATHDILQAVAQLRASGLSFIQVPPRYYRNLQQRQGFRKSAAQWAEIEAQEILVDWHSDDPEKMLLQTFTQPIFSQPTFFFESIERRCQAQGFGEGNFQALFQAIEQEQIKREK